MKFLPTNTLAHFHAAPQVHQHDLSDVPVSVFAEATKKYRANCGHTSPTEDAVTFYVLNHAASIVRKTFTANEPLPEWAQAIMTVYTDACVTQGERMLHYILSITTREMRHLGSKGHASDKYLKIGAAAGPAMRAFIEKIVTMDESAAVQYYMNHPPQATVGQYLKAMSVGFHKGGWGAHADACSYGGPKWGMVADAALAMVTGETSMEMLVDTGFTLAHNGGPIFNKGMMYQGQDANKLLMILDLQRAGQLLDLMVESNTYGIVKTTEAQLAANWLQAWVPLAFKGFIDWVLVNELRPANQKDAKYAKQIAAQVQPTQKPTPKPVTPLMTTLLGKKAKVTGAFKVYPNQVVSIVERVS